MSQVYEAYRRPEDLGAPPSESTTMVRLTIDGKTVTVPEGTKVIRAAALAGINIPKLCASDMLESFGSIQWPCNEKAEQGTPTMHVDAFVRGKGLFG